MKVGVLGATGFTGEKLVEILLSHPKVEVTYLASRTPHSVSYYEFFPKFKGKTDLKCEPLNIEKAAECADILFLSLPHTVSMEYVPYLLKKGKKVIDLSADYRLDSSLYKEYYGKQHEDKNNLAKAVYGLPEINEEKITKAGLVANPGCYPTSVILALFPLLRESLIDGKIIVDAKSSITGAGRKAVIDYHYSNISGNIWAYKPFVHQHTPEIKAVLTKSTNKNIDILFVPHVVGVEAGIYSTIYVSFKKKVTGSQIRKVYDKYYKQCPFIRLNNDSSPHQKFWCGDLPKLKNVVGTNFCDIGFSVDYSGKNSVIVSCIDNLIKGAAGTAVQNMNIMAGWDQTLGLL
ncbi:MAG: N-acetyl-gamma-glutamyl-phosphate reductase [Candidatus Omnitrophota bacterium]|nr:N-acetyl-gamma-glutamyl-phosphate reductase [Candidatus Omnitrophota bacterium]